MDRSAVVRIYTTTQDPDHEAPWQSLTPETGTGSGVVVDEGLVLTGAHVVANATFVQVQKLADPNKYVAWVERICHDADLALLRVDDAGFMNDVRVAELGELPNLRDRVSVVGYPVGGEEISVTEGVVSRVEVQRYAHSQRHLLAVTVDAAINEGNSGGPVIQDGRVVGIAFQSYEEAENAGEMVPTPIIRHFLGQDGGGREVRIPGLGVKWQNLENPALRRSLGLGELGGVLVRAVEYQSSAWGALEPGDVLLSIDRTPIANNGTVRYQGRYRTSFWVRLGELSIGDRLRFEVWRDGAVLELEVVLREARDLVPRSVYDRPPTWYVYAGLVFQVLTLDFLRCWDDWWDSGPKEFLHLYYAGHTSAERQEIVVLSQVLADEINVGYEDFHTESVQSVGGVVPRDMRHFVELVERAPERIEIKSSRDSLIVLDAAQARAAGPRILERYDIPADRSRDLRRSFGASEAG